MTADEIAAIRERNEEFKAVQAAVVQPSGQIVEMAEMIDTLLVELESARSLLDRILHDDKLELTDGVIGDLGDYLGTSA